MLTKNTVFVFLINMTLCFYGTHAAQISSYQLVSMQCYPA